MHTGSICRNVTASGRRRIAVSAAGATPAYGSGLFDTLTADRDNTHLMLDSTIVRVHQQAASGKSGTRDQAQGRSRGGLTTKIHMLADTIGRLLRFSITLGQASDIACAPALLEGQRAKAVLADKAYDGNDLRDRIAGMSAETVISSKRTRKVPISHNDRTYSHRNQIKRGFGRLKHLRHTLPPTNHPLQRLRPSRRRHDVATLNVEPAY